MESNNNGVSDMFAEKALENTVKHVYSTVHKTGNTDVEIEHLNENGKEKGHFKDPTDLGNIDQAGAINSNLDIAKGDTDNLENVEDSNVSIVSNVADGKTDNMENVADGNISIVTNVIADYIEDVVSRVTAEMKKADSEITVEYSNIDELAIGKKADDDKAEMEEKNEPVCLDEDEHHFKSDNASCHSEPDIPELPSYNDVVQYDSEEHHDQQLPEPAPELLDSPKHNFHPRLCHIKKWPDFQGYGFNLHAEKDKKGQYIGLVDASSPAEDANLKKGDRIVEVNGENVEDQTYQYTINAIKAGGNETKLLVVDPETDEYYKNNAIKITSKLPEVIFSETKTKEAKKEIIKEAAIEPTKEATKEPTKETTKDGFTPRLCHIIKWPDFNGYGFNLHAEKERGGQYIGKIDDNSPAQDGGLRESDRIIEVNGVNIENDTHQQVIAKIKAGGEETKLLVVDREADRYYKSKGITVTSTMSEVKCIQTTRKSSGSLNGEKSSSAPQPTKMTPVKNVEPVKSNDVGAKQVSGSGDLLSMNLTAKEMRELLALKKKQDPKLKADMDFKSKYELFQKM